MWEEARFKHHGESDEWSEPRATKQTGAKGMKMGERVAERHPRANSQNLLHVERTKSLVPRNGCVGNAKHWLSCREVGQARGRGRLEARRGFEDFAPDPGGESEDRNGEL